MAIQSVLFIVRFLSVYREAESPSVDVEETVSCLIKDEKLLALGWEYLSRLSFDLSIFMCLQVTAFYGFLSISYLDRLLSARQFPISEPFNSLMVGFTETLVSRCPIIINNDK